MKITKLEPSKRVSGRWLAFLEDGTILRVGESEVARWDLYTGKELSPEGITELTRSAEQGAARARALELLAGRAMSRKELADKLTAQPRNREKKPLCTPEEAEEICDRMEELGYLNDREYAASVARHYSAKGYGPARVRDELYRRGVPRQFWDDAMEESREPEEGIDAFLQKRFRGKTPDQKDLKRAADALARRGYGWSQIREGLNRYGAGIDEE